MSNRVLIFPPSIKRMKTVDNRPSFFEPITLFPDPTESISSKVENVRNFLSFFPSGMFKHTEDLSRRVMKELNCRCERISDDTCVYSKQ